MATQVIEIHGERFVVIPETEYRELHEDPDHDLPSYPPCNADDTMPAVEFARITIARELIRDRRALGWSRCELAERAGVRPATIARAESGDHSPSVKTMEKIDQALNGAAADEPSP